jgi:hypothetical protein
VRDLSLAEAQSDSDDARGESMLRKLTAYFAGIAGALAYATAAAIPHLEPQGSATRLIVNGRPMLIIGGELGNSSASSAAYMAPHWAPLRRRPARTLRATAASSSNSGPKSI